MYKGLVFILIQDYKRRASIKGVILVRDKGVMFYGLRVRVLIVKGYEFYGLGVLRVITYGLQGINARGKKV